VVSSNGSLVWIKGKCLKSNFGMCNKIGDQFVFWKPKYFNAQTLEARQENKLDKN
jgi:hypothetical protein